MFLQEQIYAAWRGRRVLSLINFDVKGVYNGVCKERLIQRMKARGIPEKLLRWIEAFCSNRTATIMVNGQCSDTQDLPQPGLPQGSPLSPVAYLFFNADLVQRRIDANGGAIAFIDDFTAWVTGPTAHSNRAGIASIIETATAWEKRSGATFEADKTSLIHFTCSDPKFDKLPAFVKGKGGAADRLREDFRRHDGLQAQIPAAYRTCSLEGAGSGDGAEEIQGPFGRHSTPALHGDSDPGGRLCVQCLDARLQG